MDNEIMKKEPSFLDKLIESLNANKAALPADFNITRFAHNSVALVNGNTSLLEYGKNNKDGGAQIRAGLMRAAYLGLDALNSECYLIPYTDWKTGVSTLQFMPSFKGAIKMAKKYSPRPIKDIYAKIIREGDFIEEEVVHGEQTINFKPMPLNSGKVIGAFAVCLYADGGLLYDIMSLDELEMARSQSKAKNSPAWKNFTTEMYKKTVLHRLCKAISLDFDGKANAAWNEGLEFEPDQRELRDKDCHENENSEDFEEVIDTEGTVVDS